jgi:hypothetical protein
MKTQVGDRKKEAVFHKLYMFWIAVNGLLMYKGRVEVRG